MAARLSTGTPWPDSPDSPQKPRSIVLLSAEDDIGDTIVPRLRAARADLARIAVLRGVRSAFERGEDGQPLRTPFSLDRDVRELERAIETMGDVGMVVIDPITAYAGRADTHNNAEVRALLAPLAELAMRTGIAVVLVTHLNKGSGVKGIYRISGSLALPAAARSAMLVVRDQDNPERRLMLVTKMNVGAMAPGMAYQVGDDAGDGRGGGAVGGWAVHLTADEAVRAEEEAPRKAARLEEAVEFLREVLKEGPMEASKALARRKGLGSPADLKRARSGPAWWHAVWHGMEVGVAILLRGEEGQEGQGGSTQEDGPLGPLGPLGGKVGDPGTTRSEPRWCFRTSAFLLVPALGCRGSWAGGWRVSRHSGRTGRGGGGACAPGSRPGRREQETRAPRTRPR
jgi:hypothetical protein